MEERKDFTLDSVLEQEDRNTFDFQSILKTIILNWQWFLLAMIISLGSAALYLRYATPIYEARAKMLIKDEDGSSSRRANLMATANLGMMTNSTSSASLYDHCSIARHVFTITFFRSFHPA